MAEIIQPSTRRGLSGTALKYIACGTMLLDHIGASCIESTFADAVFMPVVLARLDLVLRLIGRIAFPIFCFLLVEGFVHTHDVKRYIGRLFLFGLLSEVPFDLAFFCTPFHPDDQNVYWTLALGVLAMAGLKHFEAPDGTIRWQGFLCAGACVLAAFLANTDYNGIGVLILCALYLTRADRKRQCIVGVALFAFEFTAPLAFVFIWFYNGQRGACSKALQKAFYWFYPVHLTLLALITNVVL